MDHTSLAAQQEMFSHNLTHKAIIVPNEPGKGFSVALFKWAPDSKSPAGESTLWESAGGPFHLDTLEAAEKIAQEHLHLLAGEVVDNTIPEEKTTLLREISRDPTAEFLSPENFTAVQLESGENISIQKIAVVHELYIIQSSESDWLLGHLEKNGVLSAWGNFDSLASALQHILSAERTS